jgi:hypothetical protein
MREVDEGAGSPSLVPTFFASAPASRLLSDIHGGKRRNSGHAGARLGSHGHAGQEAARQAPGGQLRQLGPSD